MHARTILENLDNGTIDQASAADLLGKHADVFYLAGSYLETRKQRDTYARQLYALQEATPETPAAPKDIVDLIDHAYATGFITHVGATTRLVDSGMEPKAAHHHVETLHVIVQHDMERANYLEFPKSAPRYCTRCGRMVKAGELSRRGICVECSSAAVEQNLIALDTKTGPAYTRWRDAMLKFAYTLEDDTIAQLRDDAPLPIHDRTLAWNERQDQHGSINTVPLRDLIGKDKYPGCDAECDLCPDLECPFRDTVADTE